MARQVAFRRAVAPPLTYPLLDDVKSLELRFLDANRQWRQTWNATPGAESLPRAISVRLTMNDGVYIERLFATQ